MCNLFGMSKHSMRQEKYATYIPKWSAGTKARARKAIGHDAGSRISYSPSPAYVVETAALNYTTSTWEGTELLGDCVIPPPFAMLEEPNDSVSASQ